MPHQLTPAQLELQAARRAAKEAKAALIAANPKAALTAEEVESRRFLKREWIDNPSAGSSKGSNKAKIVTWNVSAIPSEGECVAVLRPGCSSSLRL